MSKNNSHTDPADVEAALHLSHQITGVVKNCMEHGGVSQAQFAKEIGVSRSSLNQVFRARDGKHLWRLPQLCAVARVLHVSVSDIVVAAETGESENSESWRDLSYRTMLYGTEPGSPERLRRMIVQFFRMDAKGSEYESWAEREDFETLFRCSLVEIEQGAPEFYDAFTKGKLDQYLLDMSLSVAVDYVFKHGGPKEVPLWVGIKKTFHT